MKHTNQLIHESSPYLLQHAHNPVNWLPFSEEAIDKAKHENKPMLISIGYSSCHWCHVMEHESFENEEIAELMNEKFVCVKVDREERPDVDHVYMDVVQQIHGSGGWPLNCFALANGRPFWGGTYFRPEQWKQLLINISELFQNQYAELEKQANELSEGIEKQNYIINQEVESISEIEGLDAIYTNLYKRFDHENGGMIGAPKFPMPVVLRFLLQYSASYKEIDALKMVELTLQKMAYGGIYDQAGGGFARYSTDCEWKVPHFEKMLYDNAQLISLYSATYKVTRCALYREVIEQTIEFIKRELTAPEGIFYSALDADSEGEEGLYYTWTAEQFADALGHYAGLAGEYYGIDAQGLWEHNRNILLRPENDDLFAQKHFLSAGELISLTGFCRALLLKARSQRSHPALDDKMLLAWNSLMISALTDAYLALDNPEYLHSAKKVANFIISKLKRPEGGLFHTWKNGKSQINAFLDDYAFTGEALLKLYAITADEHWLHETESLVAYLFDHFYDSRSGFFWFSENNDKQVFARKIEIYDGVIPSGNSAVASLLDSLGTFLDNTIYIEKSRQMVTAMYSRIKMYPTAYANWASLALSGKKEKLIAAIIGKDSVSLIKELYSHDLQGVFIYGSLAESNLPYFVNRFVEGKTLIYICTGKFCLPPVETVEEAISLINQKNLH
jgi:uncharacterized protein